MLSSLLTWVERLPTAAKLLLILTAVLLPIGLVLTWVGGQGIRGANDALIGRVQDQDRLAARSVESLLARNALALRIAANGALADGQDGACDRARRSLAIAPAISQQFELEAADGKPLCSGADIGDTARLPLVAPGDIRVSIASNGQGVAVRTGVIGGMATAVVPVSELRTAALEIGGVQSMVLIEAGRELRVLGPPKVPQLNMELTQWPIASGSLVARVGAPIQRITTADRLVLLLPVLMWVLAALLTWVLVTRLLIGRSAICSRKSAATRPATSSACRASSARRAKSRNCAICSAGRSPASTSRKARWLQHSTASVGWSAKSITG